MSSLLLKCCISLILGISAVVEILVEVRRN